MVDKGKVKILALKTEMDFETIVDMMKRIYQVTKEEDLLHAIQSVKDLHYHDSSLLNDAMFLGKLIIFEASGQVISPINLGDIYISVIEENGNN